MHARKSHNLAVLDEGRYSNIVRRTSPGRDSQGKSWRVMTIGSQFVEELSHALSLRRVSDGFAMLDKAEGAWTQLSPDQPNATKLLLLIAQWVDVGYRDYHLLDSLLAKVPIECRRKLSVEDYLRLRMVEGFRALSAEEVDAAIEILDVVLRTEPGTADDHMLTVAHFWKGRAHRKKGEYELATQEIVCARERAQISHEDAVFTSVIQIHESWLLFQKGMKKDALRLLSRAEDTLKNTDHFLARGNIESSRGRIVRRYGEYALALEHFERAIDLYSAGNPKHRNLARALVNSAYVKRLLALQLRKRIDARARNINQERFNSQLSNGSATNALRSRYRQLSDQASSEVRRAREIYASQGHSGGLGAVAVSSGYLHLDGGDIDVSAREALEAYRIGQDKNDHILMARARVLQAATENAKIEEQLGEEVDSALHANRARQFTEEALRLAKHTQNRRLLAAAYVARAMTAANEFFQEWDLARDSVREAMAFIGEGESDHLLDDIAALKTRIMRASGINDTLRGWSEGIIAGKTFQQVTEEFAEIVIPKVWQREGRKVSRVAESLSVSPKKVRRILRRVGILDDTDSTQL